MGSEKSGFQKLAEVADDMPSATESGSGIAAGAQSVTDQAAQKLNSVGIDPDDTVESAEKRMIDLQRMVNDEIRVRPFRALGWAAAAGFVLGIISAR